MLPLKVGLSLYASVERSLNTIILKTKQNIEISNKKTFNKKTNKIKTKKKTKILNLFQEDKDFWTMTPPRGTVVQSDKAC